MTPRNFCCSLVFLAVLSAAPLSAQEGPGTGLRPDEVQHLADYHEPLPLAPLAAVPCVGGMADIYPCENVDLLSFFPLASIGGGSGNDIWGWTDPLTGREYAVAGRSNGTAFIDITDPVNAVYLGNLPTHSGNSLWRDMKVYANHAFIVNEADNHGMQVFDLTRLRSVVSPPVTFTEDAHYGFFGRAHNIAINEESGFAYAVGSRQGTQQCGSGLHMIDIHNPTAPVFAGCFSTDGYTHDVQCVNYSGPDADYAGREVCFASNEDTLTIVDVTNKGAPAQISRTPYTGSGYTHQGWLTEDHTRFLVDDELDESNFGHNTKTWVWNVENLDAPSVAGFFLSPTGAIDHNQYVKGNFVYQANYRSGLRILSLDNVASASLSQVGFFDLYPSSNSANFNGAWSTFPYFASGNVVLNGIEQGVFVLRPNLCAAPPTPTAFSATPNGNNRVDLAWNNAGAPPGTTYRVERAFGACGSGTFETLATGLTGTSHSDTTASGGLSNSYRVVAEASLPGCASPPSSCVAATPSGACTAPPAFGGLETVINPASATCSLDLSWSGATPRCAGPASYNVYRSASSGFTPSEANRIASGVVGTSYADGTVVDGESYFYIVRAVDGGNGAEDTNTVERSATPTGPDGTGIWETGAEIGDPTFGATTGNRSHVGWHPDSEHVRTGLRAFVSHLVPLQCSDLNSPTLELVVGGLPMLSFWSHHDMHDGDGGVVSLSADDGATWTVLPLLGGGTPTTLPNADNGCGFPAGTPAVAGHSHEGEWTYFSASLLPWAGDSVRLRFTLASDAVGETEGWFIDDIAVTHARVPLACTTAAMFTDGFETGDSSAWSLVVNN